MHILPFQAELTDTQAAIAQALGESRTAVALGMFDGVHVGHTLVLENALRQARLQQVLAVAVTFEQHPQVLLSQTPTPQLSSLNDRLQAFAQMGFDATVVLRFTEGFRAWTADAFIQTFLVDTLKACSVSVGYDYRFGKHRQGDGTYLRDASAQLPLAQRFDVQTLDPVTVDEQIVSSTLIRKLLSTGRLEHANALLGRPYAVQGEVVHGQHRGRTIGFPTANLALLPDRLCPQRGVYAGWAAIVNPTLAQMPCTRWPAVCNIGTAPTFAADGTTQATIEVHVLSPAPESLYGQTLCMQFTHHLRDEQRFSGAEALVTQITADCTRARALLGVTEATTSNPAPCSSGSWCQHGITQASLCETSLESQPS